MLGSCILVVLCVCLLLVFNKIQRPKNFPPGPRPIPIFGSLFHYNIRNPLKDFKKIHEALPVVRSLPLPFKKAFDNYSILKILTTNMINKHKTTRVPGNPRDFVDCYLDELDKRGNKSTFSEEQLVMCIIGLNVAGTETTSNTFLTAILFLMAYPDIQKRCQQEIDEVMEGKSQVSFEDRHNMPYTQAMIHECQRVADTVPLSGFHCTTRDTELKGYNTPKGTTIIPNLSSVLSEEGQWKFPHDFNPPNFLNDKGQFDKPDAFLPFSSGPRMCLGEGLARMELEYSNIMKLVVGCFDQFKFQ